MTKFSLAFLVKRSIRITFLILICLVLLFQILLSLYLFKYTLKVVSQIDPALGKISVGAVSCDIINGYSLHDVYIMDNSKPAQVLFFAKRLTFYFDPVDIFSKKLNIKRLKLQKAVFYVDKSSGSVGKLIKLCTAAYYKFLENQILPMEIGLNNPKIIIKKSKIFFVDWSDITRGFWVLNMTSSTSVQGKEIISSGESNIKYAFAKGVDFVNMFNNQIFNQDFDYQLKANFTDSDFTLETFDLTLGYDHIRGQAILKDYNTSNPMLNLIVNSSNISLESVSSLARDFDTHGSFNVSAIVRGPLENTKFIFGLNFLGCSLQFPQISYLKNIVGKVYWSNDSVKLDNIFLIINDIPLKLNSEFSNAKNALKFSAQVSLRDDATKIALLPKVLEIDFSGNKQDNIFIGDSKILVKAQDLNTYAFRLDGFKFSQKAGQGMISAKDLNFSSWPSADEKAPPKRLNFSDFSTRFNAQKEALKIEDTKFEGLNGKASGNFIFNFLPKYFYNLKLAAENLDTSHIQDGLQLPYNLLGTASAKAFSNSGSKNFLQGIILVKDGRLQDTAVLLALSNYMDIASLKAIEFDNLQLNYSFLKGGLYRYGLRSIGKRAIVKANIHVGKNNEVSGYFKARLSRDLLTESPKFRKLLKILGDKSKFVEFPFTLSGTIHNPRLQWLANDFKRSLERRIPAWYRRNMQKAIDEAVDEMNSPGS